MVQIRQAHEETSPVKAIANGYHLARGNHLRFGDGRIPLRSRYELSTQSKPIRKFLTRRNAEDVVAGNAEDVVAVKNLVAPPTASSLLKYPIR